MAKPVIPVECRISCDTVRSDQSPHPRPARLKMLSTDELGPDGAIWVEFYVNGTETEAESFHLSAAEARAVVAHLEQGSIGRKLALDDGLHMVPRDGLTFWGYEDESRPVQLTMQNCSMLRDGLIQGLETLDRHPIGVLYDYFVARVTGMDSSGLFSFLEVVVNQGVSHPEQPRLSIYQNGIWALDIATTEPLAKGLAIAAAELHGEEGETFVSLTEDCTFSGTRPWLILDRQLGPGGLLLTRFQMVDELVEDRDTDGVLFFSKAETQLFADALTQAGTFIQDHPPHVFEEPEPLRRPCSRLSWR